MDFSQKDAIKIAKKLGANFRKRKHNRAVIRHEGKLVASYGISNNSRDRGHDYIPKQLDLTKDQTRDLADCKFSAEDYFETLREKKQLERK